jgi:hypothetical protein
MKNKTEIKGFTKYRQERLWKHLLEVERVTGKRLRRTPRALIFEYGEWCCPIGNFVGLNGVTYWHHGIITWGWADSHNVYTVGDSIWWGNLTPEIRCAITKWIQAKIREYYKK